MNRWILFVIWFALAIELLLFAQVVVWRCAQLLVALVPHVGQGAVLNWNTRLARFGKLTVSDLNLICEGSILNLSAYSLIAHCIPCKVTKYNLFVAIKHSVVNRQLEKEIELKQVLIESVNPKQTSTFKIV